MTQSPIHISSWAFSALTFSVVGHTPSCVGGAQEIGGATRPDAPIPVAPGDDRITRSPEIQAARERWEAAKAVVPQAQALPDPRPQLVYQGMLMTEPHQGAMSGLGRGISFPGKPSLKGDIAQRDAERLEQKYHATPFRLIARSKWASVDRHIVTLMEEGSR